MAGPRWDFDSMCGKKASPKAKTKAKAKAKRAAKTKEAEDVVDAPPDQGPTTMVDAQC